MDRREFLRLSMIAAGGLALPKLAHAGLDDLWQRPRYLWVRRQQTGEVFKDIYWENGRYIPEAYRQICTLTRDVQANIAVGMAPRTFDLLYGIQAWLADHQITRPILVTSGYRTKNTNQKTEGAVKDSRHTHGEAIDWLIPQVSSEHLWKMAVWLRGGGAGFYPEKNFIHTDTGPQRAWRK